MKRIIAKIITAAVLLTGNSTFAKNEFAADSGVVCKKPRSKLYSKETVNEPTHFELMADFKSIRRREGSIKAVLKYNDANNQVRVVPVVLTGRGNSRGLSCSFKPFRMAFAKPKTAIDIQNKLNDQKQDVNSKEYLKLFFNEFLSMKYDLENSAKPDADSLFAKLGDDVKVVTHCGQASGGGDWPGGRLEEDQDQRLLTEYYIYEILEKLRWPAESAKLVYFKYYDKEGLPVFSDPQSGEAQPKLAFFREPPTSIGKRCHLSTKPPGKKLFGNGQIEDNRLSDFVIHVINNFVVNTDFSIYDGNQGHNTNYLFDEEGKRHFAAYDFDLAVSVSGYNYDKSNEAKFKNSLESGKLIYSDFLKKYQDKDLALSVAKRIVQAAPEMRAVLEHSLLNADYKKRAQLWLETQITATEEAIKTLENKK